MAEESDAHSMGQPSRMPQDVPNASPSSSNSMEAKFQHLLEENQQLHVDSRQMKEQLSMLQEAMQALLTRLPQTPQESISQEHPQLRDHSTEVVHAPQTIPASTPTMVCQETPPTNTPGFVPLASPSTHGVEQQVPPPYVPMPIGQFWPPSAFMQYPPSSSGGTQQPYSAPHTATWPGFASPAAIPPPTRGPQAIPTDQSMARPVPQQTIPLQVVQPTQVVPQPARVIDPEIQALKDALACLQAEVAKKKDGGAV